MKRRITIATLFLAAFAAAGTVSAAIPSADGVISACKSKDGSIRLIDTDKGQACNGQQQLVEWNQQGPQGPAGADGVSGYEIVYDHTALNSTGDKYGDVFCPAGKKVLGGGAAVEGTQDEFGTVIVSNVALIASQPYNEYGWGAHAAEQTATDVAWRIKLWAICADVD